MHALIPFIQIDTICINFRFYCQQKNREAMPVKCQQCGSQNTDSSRLCSDCSTQLGFSKDIPDVTRTIETCIQELTRKTLFANS